jgi:biopolymer transport protein ExbD
MAKLREAMLEDDTTLAVDMSPMIDLVFLLLIFFIVNAQMVNVQVDEKVRPPVAENAQQPDGVEGRLLVNIRADGSMRDEAGQLLDEALITTQAKAHVAACAVAGITPRLMIRADRVAPTAFIKRVNRAAAAGGISSIIYSAFAVDPGE